MVLCCKTAVVDAEVRVAGTDCAAAKLFRVLEVQKGLIDGQGLRIMQASIVHWVTKKCGLCRAGSDQSELHTQV